MYNDTHGLFHDLLELLVAECHINIFLFTYSPQPDCSVLFVQEEIRVWLLYRYIIDFCAIVSPDFGSIDCMLMTSHV